MMITCVDECVDVIVVEKKVKAVTGNKCERKLRIGTWNFAGLCSERKQKEVGQVVQLMLSLARNRGRGMALFLVYMVSLATIRTA